MRRPFNSIESLAVRMVFGVTVGLTFFQPRAEGGHRRNVLEAPVAFVSGYSVSREFTVDMQSEYWLAIRLPGTFRSEPVNAVPADSFSAEFTIRTNTGVVAEGTNATEPRAAIVTGDSTTRILTRFRASPGIRYSLTFRLIRAGSEQMRSKPALLIFLDPHVN